MYIQSNFNNVIWFKNKKRNFCKEANFIITVMLN